MRGVLVGLQSTFRLALCFFAFCTFLAGAALAQVPSPTTTSVSSSQGPIGYQETVTLTATVAASSGDTPTGSITFFVNGSAIGTNSLSGGQATRTYTNNAATSGNISVSASYAGNTTFGASSGSVDVAVTSVPSTTTLTSSPNPSVVGQAVALSANVVGRGGARVSGTVQFFDGATALSGVISVSAAGPGGATATYTATGLTQGDHTINAVFLTNNPSYALSSTSAPRIQTVDAGSLTPTTTSLSSSQNPIGYQEAITLTATVAGSGGPPTGSVAFYANGNAIGTATLSVAGQASLAFSNGIASGGNIVFQAIYLGNTTFQTSSGSITVPVSPVPTTTTLTLSPNPSSVGQAVVFSASVVGRGGAYVSGTVRFYEGSTDLSGPISVSGSGTGGGTVTYTATGLTEGAHTIHAIYTSGGYGLGSTSNSVTQTVNASALPSTTTSVSSSQGTIGYYEAVTLTATVSSTDGTPTGQVSFYVNGSLYSGNVTLSGGQATLAYTNYSTSGSLTFSATYLGNTSFQGSTGTVVVPVSQSPSTTTLTSSPNPSVLGQAVALSAKVVGRGGTYVSGTVRFFSGSTPLSDAISVSGGGPGGATATFVATGLSEGTHSITATYTPGNSIYAQSSTSAPVAQVVNTSSLVPTTTSVSSSQSPMGYYETVTLTATVAGSGGPPTGTINFYVNGSSIGTATLSGGQASRTYTNSNTSGTTTVSAVYLGDATFRASSGIAAVPISAATSTTTLISSVNPSSASQAVVFTANVIGRGGAYVVGTVRFMEGSTVLSTVSVSTWGPAGATATYTALGLSVGTHTISAVYVPNSSFYAQSSTSASIAQVVNTKSPQEISFTSSPPSGRIVGGPDYTVTATANSGLPVTFSIDVASAGICTISSSTVSFIGAGTCTVNADQAGNATYNPAPQVHQSITVGKANQTVAFSSTPPGDAVVGGPTYAAAADATSGLPVTLSIGPASASICTISGSTVSFTGAGTCTVLANQAGNNNYLAAPQVQQSITVGKGSQTISFTSTAPSDAVVGGATYAVAASATSGLSVALTVDPAAASICTISGSTVSFTGVGTCTLNANQAGDDNYLPAAQIQQTIAVGKGSQTISFTSTAPSDAVVGGATYTVAASATSSLAVTFSIDPSAASMCTISGETVSFIGAGNCLINADQAGDPNYLPAPQIQQSFAVGKSAQEITFTSTAPADAVVGGPTYTVAASGGVSGLPVTFAIDPSSSAVCTISGDAISFTGVGACLVNADQAGDANYLPAPQAQQSIAVGPGSQSIAFTSTAPSDAMVGGADYMVAATGGASGNPVTFSIDAASGSACTISDSSVSFTGAGTCVVNADQSGNSNYLPAPQVQQSIPVGKGMQTIAFTSTAPTDAAVGGATYTVTATGGASVNPVTFSIDSAATGVCTISGATITFTDAGACIVNADQDGDANYLDAPQAQHSIPVGKGAQVVTFTSSAPTDAAVGGPSYTATASASSGLPVALSIDPASSGVCTISEATVSFVTAGVCIVLADQGGNGTYLAAPQAQQSITVGKGVQTIAFSSVAPSDAVVAGPGYTVAATATSGLPVTFSIDAASASVCTISGDAVSFTGAGTCTVNADQVGDANYLPAPQAQQSFIVGKGSQTIAFSSAAPNDAVVAGPGYTVAATSTSGLPVTFSIDTASASVCTISGDAVSFTGAGTCTVNADQVGDANYLPAPQAQQSFMVGKGSQTIAFSSAAPNDAVVAGPGYTVAATSTSGLPVTFSIDTASASVCTISGDAVSFTGAGTCTVNADQVGDANYLPAPQAQQSFMVGKGSQTIAFSSVAPSDAVVAGPGYTVAATATSSLPVTFSIDTASASVCTISGDAVSFTGAGTCTINADQVGDANYLPAPQAQQSFTVGKGSQTIAFTRPADRTYVDGDTEALDATASPSGLPVSFASTTNSVCSVSASIVSILSAGTCSIVASQGGDANYDAAVDVVRSFEIEKITTTAGVVASQNPSLVGQPVAFTATVSPPTATGTVTFRDGATTLGTSAITSGTATFTTAALASGGHSITAEYAGDGNHAAATSPALSHSVTPNGSVLLAVATTEGDGTFAFSSPAPTLNLSISTSGGSGQSAAVSLNPGTYTVTVALPDGFGLTSISCTDGDSVGSAAAKTVQIALDPAETVTCMFATANSRKKTVEVISQFMNRRNDLLLSNGPDTSRQIDRLRQAEGTASPGASNFSEDDSPAIATASRLGASAALGSPLGGASRSSFTSAGARFGETALANFGHAVRGATNAVGTDHDDIGTSTGLSPLSVTGSSEGQTQFSFSASLSQLGQYYRSADQRKVSSVDGAMGIAGLKPESPRSDFSPFDLWVEGYYMEFDSDDENGTDGKFGVVYVGADYVVAPWLLVGALVQFDSLEQTSRKDQFEIKGHGVMAGPYATLRLSDSVFLQGRAAWGKSDNEVSPFMTYTDSFDTERWLVSGTLSGDWTTGPWRFRPTASLSYIEDVSEAYTDSLGVRIPGLAASLGQVKAGPEISYRYDLGEGAHIEPHASVDAIWNFDSSDQVTDFGGTLAGPEELRGRVEAGVKAQLTNGLILDITGTYDGIGSSDFEAFGGRALARIPLN